MRALEEKGCNPTRTARGCGVSRCLIGMAVLDALPGLAPPLVCHCLGVMPGQFGRAGERYNCGLLGNGTVGAVASRTLVTSTTKYSVSPKQLDGMNLCC